MFRKKKEKYWSIGDYINFLTLNQNSYKVFLAPSVCVNDFIGEKTRLKLRRRKNENPFDQNISKTN